MQSSEQLQDILPDELLFRVQQYTDTPTLLAYRAAGAKSYHISTLAIFHKSSPEFRQLQFSLLESWLIESSKPISSFLKAEQTFVIGVLTRYIQDKTTTAYEKLISLLTLRKLLDPIYHLPAENMMNISIHCVGAHSEAACRFMRFTYLLSPNEMEQKYFVKDFAMAMIIKCRHPNTIAVDEALLKHLALFLHTTCLYGDETHSDDEKRIFKQVVKHFMKVLSPQDKRVMLSHLSKSKSHDIAQQARIEAVGLLFSPDRGAPDYSTTVTTWLLSNMVTYHNPFALILTEVLDKKQVDTLLKRISTYYCDYTRHYSSCLCTAELFDVLLSRVTERERVTILLDVMKQEFRVLSEELDQCMSLFLGKHIKAPASFDHIKTALLALGESSPAESFQKYNKLSAFCAFAPYKLNLNEMHCLTSDNPFLVRMRERILEARFMNGILDLENDENRSYVFNSILKDRRSICRMELINAIGVLLQYQQYFTDEQNEMILTFFRNHLESKYNWVVILLDHFSSFTPGFAESAKVLLMDFCKGKISTIENDEEGYIPCDANPKEEELSLQVAMGFLSNRSLCTHENFTLIESVLTKKCIGRLLIEHANAMGGLLYDWPTPASSSSLHLGLKI